MDIQGTMRLVYEVLRTKEDRVLMVWEDERQAMTVQMEILKSENAAQAAIIKRQQIEYDNLMKTVAGFNTIAGANSSSSRNFLANIPKPVRQNTTKEAPSSHSKRLRETNPDEEPDFISIDRSKSTKKGPMDSFFNSATPAAVTSTRASTSKAATKAKQQNKSTKVGSVQSRLAKANTTMDDSWLYENTADTSAMKRSSADRVKVEAEQMMEEEVEEVGDQEISSEIMKGAKSRREVPATSSSSSTVPVHAVHHQGMQMQKQVQVHVQAKAPMAVYEAPLVPEYITVLDSLEADAPFPLSQEAIGGVGVEDDDVTVAAPSQEEHLLLSQELQEHHLAPPVEAGSAPPRGGEEVRFPDSQATCASQPAATGGRYEYSISSVSGMNNGVVCGNGSGVYKDRRLSLLPASPSQTQSQLYSQEINILPTDNDASTPVKDTTNYTIHKNITTDNANDEETNINDDLFVDLEPIHSPHLPTTVTRNATTTNTSTTTNPNIKEHMFVPQRGSKREEIIDLSYSPNKENKRRKSDVGSGTGGVRGGSVYDKQDVLHDVSNMLPPQSNGSSVRKGKKSTHITANKTLYDTLDTTNDTTTHDAKHNNAHTTPYPYRTSYDTTTAANAAANRLVVSFTDLSPEITLPSAVSRSSVSGSSGAGGVSGSGSDVSAYIDRLVPNNTSSGSKSKSSAKSSKHSNALTNNIASTGDAQYDLAAITNHPNTTHTNTTHHTNAAATSTKRNLLSTKQQHSFTLWLHEYRKKWVNYWHYLSDSVVTEIVRTVPVTMKELVAVPGIGADMARLNGEGILCTIYAYLEHNDLLHLFPHATLPTLPKCPTWTSPFSEEAEVIRAYVQEHGVDGARYSSNEGEGVVASTSSKASSSSKSRAKPIAASNTNTTGTNPTNNPINPTTTSTSTSSSSTTSAAAAGGAGRSTYNTAKCIETVRSREQRAALPGYTCEECSRFYETMQHQGIMCMTDSQMRREVLQACSRHKARWTPPGTPEGFWGLTLHTPDDWK